MMNNHQTNSNTQSSLGYFFPSPKPLPPVTKSTVKGIKFRGKRTDLQVYHLAYGTKKLKACTYRRMLKRQDRINKRKSKIVKIMSPQDKIEKAKKEKWLNQIEQLVKNNNLKSMMTLSKRPVDKKKFKLIKKKKKQRIKKKINTIYDNSMQQ